MGNTQKDIRFSMRGDAEIQRQMETLRRFNRDIRQHLQESSRYHYSSDEIACQAINIIQEYNFHYDVSTLVKQLNHLYSHIELGSVGDITSLRAEANEIAQSLMSSVCSDVHAAEFLACELLEQFFDKTVPTRPGPIAKVREESKFYIIDAIYPGIRKSLWWRNAQKDHQELLAQNKKLKLQRNIFLLLFVATCAVCMILVSISCGSPPSQQESEQPPTISHNVDYITIYWGSKKSDVIHKSSCRYAKNLARENRVYYKSVEDAEKDGRTPCSVCLGE